MVAVVANIDGGRVYNIVFEIGGRKKGGQRAITIPYYVDVNTFNNLYKNNAFTCLE